MWRTALVSLVTLLAAALPTRAQPLADRVPADAVVYVGWAGANSMGPGFEGSHLKAMLDSAEIARFVNEVLPQLAQRLAQEQPMAGGQLEIVNGILGPMWSHPTALYVGPVDPAQANGPPTPRVALICDAGEDAAALRQRLQELVKQAGRDAPVPIAVRGGGNLVALVVGRVPELDALLAAKPKGKAIQGVESFATAMAVQPSPVLAGYVDAEALIRMVDDAAEQGGDGEMQREWPAVRDALGLAGLKRISFACGFEGKDWGTHAFIEAPAPRQGLLAMLEAEPVSDNALRAIPSSATMAGVGRADLGGIFDAIRQGLEKFSPETAKECDDALAQVNKALSLDVRQDVLAPLGDEWSYYVAPEVTGRGPLGLVVVNRLRDEGKARATSDKLRDLANSALGQQLPPDVKVSFKQAAAGDVTVHYLATPFVTPSWVIQNGNLYFGLYPQVVTGAAAHVSREGKSILDNEGFTALRKRLGDPRATTYQFYDLPGSAPTSYQGWLLLSSFGKFGDVYGIDTPPMLLPPLTTLLEHLSVAGSTTWVDDAGWHFRGVTPFPGGTLIASETAGMWDLQTSAVLAGVLLPSLNRAREQANRIKSANNLRQIGLGVQMYAAEHKGRFPDDLAAIHPYLQSLEPFVSPHSGTTVPQGLEGDELKAWINESTDYVYAGAGKTARARADEVIAYERPEGVGEGLYILFADGHVEYQEMPQATQTIEGGQVDAPAGDDKGDGF
jgi:prepilin-type processing-associated H-X9-DG protein